MTDVCEVIITAPDANWLVGFVKGLVHDRLCAGAHHVVEIRSIYRWNGDVYDRLEARVAMHTRLTLVPQIVDKANSTHPYDVPCVVALPIVAGNPAYIKWILEETSASPAS